MFKRALVFRRHARSLGAAFVLTIVLTLVMTIATPGAAARAEEAVVPTPVEAAAAASVEPDSAASVDEPPVEGTSVDPVAVEPAPAEPAPVDPAPAASDTVASVPVVPAPSVELAAEPAASEVAQEAVAIGELDATASPELAAGGDALVQITCGPGRAYAVSADGAIHLITRVGSSDNLTAEAVLPATAGWADVDGLGISVASTTMYAFRSAPSGMSSLLTLTSANGAWTEVPAVIGGHDRPLTAGAVSLADGQYYVGGFDGATSQAFRIYRVASTGAVTPVGWFDAGTASGAVNADMAFDQAGNLYVVRGDTSATRYTVTAAALAGATGGQLERTLLDQRQGGSQPNTTGLAFTESGYALVSNGTHVRSIDPSSWKTQGGNNNMGFELSDLAGCTGPVTVTLRKDVVARADADDQFLLTLRPGSDDARTAQTSGGATGIQAQQVGPIAVVAGTRVSLLESVVNGRSADYRSSWRCTNGSSGSGTAASSVTISGGSVVCTFTNIPVSAPPQLTTVTVSKVVVDADGANGEPGVGWELGAGATGQGVSMPAGSATTVAADERGSARWSVQYGLASALASITVWETQERGFQFDSGTCVVTPLVGLPLHRTIQRETVTLTNVAPGSAVECTIVNRALPAPTTLALEVRTSGSATPDDWQVSAAGTEGALPGPSGAAGSSAATASVTPGVAYRLALGEGPITHVQIGSWTCSDAAGASVPVDADSVRVQLGAAVTCSVQTGTAQLVLLKQIEGGGALRPDQFTLTATPDDVDRLGLEPVLTTGTDVLASAESFEVRPGVDYALAEQSQYAYLGLRIERHDPQLDRWSPIADPTALRLEPGEHAVIRFVNAAPPTLMLPVTGGVGADSYLLGGAAMLLLAIALLTGTRMRDLRRRGRLT